MKYFITLFATFLCLSVFGQHNGQVYDLVKAKQDMFRQAPNAELFQPQIVSTRTQPEISEVVREGTILQLDVKALSATRRLNPDQLTMSIPRAGDAPFELELIESNVIAPDFTLYASSDPNRPVDYRPGRHYMGIVQGDRHSVVAISLFDDHIVGMINTDEGNFVLGQIENTRDQYILYNDKNLVPEFDWGCGTPDDGVGYTVEEITPSHKRDAGDCVRIYVEVHEDITNGKGGVSQASDYVTAVFNQSAILYANDGITITISEMFVWNTTSPYTSGSTSTLLSQFQSNVGNFNGDLGHLVGYAGGGGIAAGFNGICNSNPDNSMCYSGINSTYANVPTYSWTVMVVTHEMGHLFGSRHTHACVWNGNNTAIDGCAGSTEGSCSLPGNPPNGGTIMSYCHLTGVGINLNNGFGPQPSAVVNNSVNNGSCLAPCNTSCSAPDGLSTSGITETAADLSWNTVNDANDYTAQWRSSGASTWNDQTTSATGISLSSLSAGTDYEWRVRSNCSGGSSVYSGIVTFTTAGTPPPEYCESTGTNVNYEWIASVSLSNLTNNTGANGGYGDFTAMSADLDPSTTYTMTLTPGFASSTYSEYWSVWIDYNGDYDFDDAGELVAQANGTSTVSPSFTTPASISVSSTRMRVSMLWNEYSTACETFTYGEVEDYTIDFGTTPPPTCDVPGGLSESAITENTAVLSWNAVSNAVDYTVQLRVQGSSTWDVEGVISGTAANATGLISGTNYEWHVRSNCASGSSAYSPISTFTTDQSSGGCTYQTVDFENFEGGWGIWNDGGSDCRRSSGDASYAIGTYCVRLRDNTTSSTMSTDNLNLANFDEITVDFTYVARSMDNSNEDFWLQISTNGGGSYSTVEEWNLNDEFVNNTRYYDQVVIAGPFTSNTRLRFRCDASGNSDWVYIDEVDVTGCNNAALYTPVIEELPVVGSGDQLAFTPPTADFETTIESDFTVYPNPVREALSIEFMSNQPQDIQIQMTAMNGKVVRQLSQSVDAGMQDMTLDVRGVLPGLYALTFIQNNEIKSELIIVQ